MKKAFLGIYLSCIMILNLNAQDTTQINKTTIDENTVWQIVEMMPEFNGGQQAMFQFLSENINYPTDAIQKNIEGKVYVRFVVEKDGSISNAVIVRGIGGGCDEEAIRVINLMPKWAPGKQDGKIVRVQYVLPVHFKLN